MQQKIRKMEKICKICGTPIYGGHNKKYCASCLKQVRADQHIKYRAREAAGISRKLGSTDICGLCGNPYSVSSSRQRYCPKCSSLHPRPSRRVLPDDYYTSGATPTGYQQGILYLYGSFAGDSFVVRSAERHYVDAVSPLFKNSTPFLQHNSAEGKKDYWVIKASTRFTFLHKPSLDDISDWTGFLRAFIEIQSCLDLRPHKSRGGAPIRTPRLRIFGARDDLEQIMRHLPAAQKKIQDIRTQTGATSAIYYQSPREIVDILDFIDGSTRNDAVWALWENILATK